MLKISSVTFTQNKKHTKINILEKALENSGDINQTQKALSAFYSYKPVVKENDLTPDQIKALIRNVPDYPKKGIQFKDITTVLKHPKALKSMTNYIAGKFKEEKIDYVVGLEARGFIFAEAIAEKLNAGFIPIRKPGKLPSDVIAQEYSLEYGTDKIEIHKDALEEGKRVLIVDDLLATGGTAQAAAKLIQKTGGIVAGAGFVIELEDLEGRKKLPQNIKIVSMVKY